MGVERIYLAELAIALGARHQDTFARRTNIEKDQYGGTHLICNLPQGNKYNAAVKWKLPAVTADWLRACFTQLQHVDETPYLVGETMAPERNYSTNDNSTMQPPAARAILTPRRLVQQQQQAPEMATPVINKRLTVLQNNSSESPFHVKTPDSPYGQVFKDNPSPATRKAWAKWIDDLPDMVEPPPKRRAPSTPLSELKRQIWSAMRKPINNETDESNRETDKTDDSPMTPIAQKQQQILSTEVNSNNEPINRRLSFHDDDTPSKCSSPLNEQLKKMDKIIREKTAGASEIRYSSHGDNGNRYSNAHSHINKYAIPSTQPESVSWEDTQQAHIPLQAVSDNDNNKLLHQQQNDNEDDISLSKIVNHKFMLSGVKDRSYYESIIKKLGSKVSTENNFDITATHLLCDKLGRNEKMLGSIASGKWILHCSYIQDCEKANKFIDEVPYQWGNPASENVIPKPNNDADRLMSAAAYHWRLKIQNNKNGGAFNGMVAILMVPPDKQDQFERLIRAGGGTIAPAKPPYNTSPNGKRITHCFIQINKLQQPVDWAMLASKGILCFAPQYLNQYLMAREPLNEREHVIPDFKKYLALLPK